MNMRISGLASGIDIDSMIKNIMKAERIPLNKMEQEKTLLEWKRDAYREINTLLAGFDDLLLKMRLTSSYRTRSVISTNDSLVSAIATNGAGEGSYTISNIERLATAATVISNENGISAEGKKVDVTKSLHSIQDSFNGNITWKTGTVQTRSFVTNKTNSYSLNLPEGVRIQTDSGKPEIVIKVDGKAFEVVTDESELATGKVFVDLENGTFKFSSDVKENSSVKVDYVTDKRIDTRTVTAETKQITIGGALIKGQVALDFTLENDETSQEIKLVDDGEGNLKYGLGNETIYGTIDYETGTIILNEDFYNEFLPPAEEDSEETPKLELKITSQQKYFSFGMSTYTSEGKKDEIFFIQGSESLNNLMSKVNSSSLGLMMFYDEHTDRISLTRTETGKFNTTWQINKETNQKEQVSAGSDIIINDLFLNGVLGFVTITESDTDFSNTYYTDSQNAKFTINGLTTERTSNTFTMNGVTFTLKRTSEANETASLNIMNDNEKLFENIVNFINKYNELVEKIETKLQEPRYKSYKPLTDDEREALTDKQQEQWEEKARSGLLRKDSILSGLVTNMRSAIYSAVNQSDLDPSMRTLSSIGITTTANYMSAKLIIDEEKLKEAIAKDPNSIELLFRGTGETTAQKGIVQRLSEIIDQGLEQLKERAGTASLGNHQFTIGRQINSLESRIDAFEDRLIKLEDRYYRQFGAMEKAIQKSNSQMSYLMQFFSS